MDASPMARGKSAGLHRLVFEYTTIASDFESLNFIRFSAIHCFVSPTQAESVEKARRCSE
jgi:hypothetical protein